MLARLVERDPPEVVAVRAEREQVRRARLHLLLVLEAVPAPGDERVWRANGREEERDTGDGRERKRREKRTSHASRECVADRYAAIDRRVDESERRAGRE